MKNKIEPREDINAIMDQNGTILFGKKKRCNNNNVLTEESKGNKPENIEYKHFGMLDLEIA